MERFCKIQQLSILLIDLIIHLLRIIFLVLITAILIVYILSLPPVNPSVYIVDSKQLFKCDQQDLFLGLYLFGYVLDDESLEESHSLIGSDVGLLVEFNLRELQLNEVYLLHLLRLVAERLSVFLDGFVDDRNDGF